MAEGRRKRVQVSVQTADAQISTGQKVIITLRGSINANHNTWGGCLYSDKLYQSRRYDITHIVDRVGGGDSFMAGLIYGPLTTRDDQKRLTSRRPPPA